MAEKEIGIAYLIWLILGLIGGHKFYLGRPLMGFFYLITCGGFVFGWLIDMFTLPSQVRKANESY